jgi:hypothetical protein
VIEKGAFKRLVAPVVGGAVVVGAALAVGGAGQLLLRLSTGGEGHGSRIYFGSMGGIGLRRCPIIFRIGWTRVVRNAEWRRRIDTRG